MRTLKGIGVSGGLTYGRAFLYKAPTVNEEKSDNPAGERETLKKGLKRAEKELEGLEKTMGERKEAGIMQAQRLMLMDPDLLDRTTELIDEGYSASYAIWLAANESAKAIGSLEDPYLRERAADVLDVAQRVISAIRGRSMKAPEDSVVIAEDLKASDVLSLGARAIATERGSATSHMSIIAGARGIPAVVGVKGLLDVKENTLIAVDGESGTVIIEPDENEIRAIEGRRKIEKEKAEMNRRQPAVTKSGKRIRVMANIGNAEEAEKALNAGAEGIGLFRTEFLLLNRESTPSEEEQYLAYKKVAETFGAMPVIIRTFDIGGDKEIEYLAIERENNPFLGVRGIRLCLQRKDLFKTQLKTLLRAGAHGNVRIMYPMIALEDEVREANTVLKEAKEELKKEGKDFGEVQVGIMIETPAAALCAELFDVDFFSIGSNDLIQYTMAADRTNEKLSYLYRADRIMKLIEHVVKAAKEKGIEVGVCGEIAGDPGIIPELVRIGIDELSMSPSKIARAKETIRRIE
jgi:phosphotransferase system enzyme I (PtsI)